MFEPKKYILKKNLVIREVLGYDAVTDHVKFSRGGCRSSHVLKTADTLPKLCDVFVIIWDNGFVSYEKDFDCLSNYAGYKVIYGAARGSEGIMYVIQLLPDGSWKTVEELKKDIEKKRRDAKLRMKIAEDRARYHALAQLYFGKDLDK